MRCSTNQGFKSLVCNNEVSNEFLYYLVSTLKQKIIEKAIGSTFLEISKTELASIAVKLPTLKEQLSIATILSDMDTEIELIEKRLAKTKALKRGMMQELLTGRIRLIIAESQQKAEAIPVSQKNKKHNWAIDEAVIISTLVHKFGSDSFPLGRKRYTKMSYLFHRFIDGKAEGYLKKAAGPYNPKTKYGGVETLARKNGYIQNHKNGKYSGFVEADKIEQALGYFKQWYGEDAMQWLEQFRYEKNDTLELLATVDMAVQDLQAEGKEATVENIKDLIGGNKEWKAKLKRDIFSDDNIAEAITRTRELLMEA